MPTFTQEQLDALDAALVQGATEVVYGDKKVVYRSLSDMIALRNLMANDLGVSTVGNSGRRVVEYNPAK